MMELGAESNAPGEAVVLESYVEPGLGNVADVLVRWGTMKIGSCVVAGTQVGHLDCF